MVRRVVELIIRYNMFDRGHRIGVAVSGGADSVALLHLLLELAPDWEWTLHVLHLDHRLRGEQSRLDAEFVRGLAEDLGLPAHIGQTDVARLARESGDNLEQAARRARLEFFRGFLKSGRVHRVALGHTRSDQAETLLFRFLRGAGTAGLAGVRPVTSEGFVRPLLGLTRGDVEDYLRRRGIAWREDASNRDLRFARNRIRHRLLPELSREWNPALVEALAHTALLAHDEEEYWRAETDRLAGLLLRIEPPAVLMRAPDLASLPAAAARRLLRRAIRLVRGDLGRIDFSHVEQVLDLVHRRKGHGRAQIPGVEVCRSFEWLRIAPAAGSDTRTCNYSKTLSAPGRFRLPGGSSELCLELAEIGTGTPTANLSGNSGYNTDSISELDWGRIGGSLELRNWRPGDGFRPAGQTGEEKMKALFQKARIPSWERRSWPIITANGHTLIWTRRFGVAQGFASTPGTRTVLRVWETE